MGDNELLYIMLAIMFFGGLSTSINKFLIMNSEEMLQKEFEYRAVAVGQEMIESAKSKKFDENMSPPTGGFRADAPPLVFESPYAMSREQEVWPNFDDVDDFGGGWQVDGYRPYKTTVETDRGDFDVSMVVYYVTPENLEASTKNRTYYKKLVVTVSNDNLAHDITLEHIYSFMNLN